MSQKHACRRDRRDLNNRLNISSTLEPEDKVGISLPVPPALAFYFSPFQVQVVGLLVLCFGVDIFVLFVSFVCVFLYLVKFM